MLDQNTFMETVREVAEIIRTSDRPLTREQILSYFTDMELNEEQQELVFTYLITPHEEPVQEPEEEEAEHVDAESEEDEPEEESILPDGENQRSEVIPDSKVFSMYLEELQQIPVYREAELDRLYEGLAQGDEAVVSPLANAWLKTVLDMAKELAMSSEDFEDIVQEGNMSLFLKLMELCGMQNTATKKDYRKWAENELRQTVKQAMQSGISELAGEVDSENAMIGKINLVNEARRYLAEEKGSVPSAEELADYTRIDKEELADILAMIENVNDN